MLRPGLALIALLIATSVGACGRTKPGKPAATNEANQPQPPIDARGFPESAYASLHEIKQAGPGAVGKTAVLRVRRQATDETRIYGNSCVDNYIKPYDESSAVFWLAFRPEDRDLIRGMPMGAPGNGCGDYESGGGGVAVQFEITGTEGDHLTAKVLTIFADPVPALTPPAGADYAAIEDMILDGTAAPGKILVFRGYHYDSQWDRIWGCPRGRDGG